MKFSAAKLAFALTRRFQNLPKIEGVGFLSVSRRERLLGERETASGPSFKYCSQPSVPYAFLDRKIQNQLQDYDIQLSKIRIYCDNTSAIAIANNPVLHSKTKHIEVRYHFIRDHVMNGDIELHFVPTEYQLADLFTKPLDVTRFNMLISELGMLNPDE
ncbi:hypothetical protein OSB04_011214 [Centaurea solstitialis]|uniref:Retrovirus-related Pol polyprotein from transposon TNT 1-94 n=1 Tax=Centaurea solstitialis TaxID=347529 RepID=A0AA38TKQ6_9ASTR|nr:hypothetical protein OSB04_011214 [Centaurea solstitialis]